MADWNIKIADLQTCYHLRVRKPVEPQVLAKADIELGSLPPELKSFYQFCNGLLFEWFKVFPIEDPNDIKHTWDSIVRANDPTKSAFLGQDKELLQQFLVFACLDGGQCAVINRSDSSIWYEEDEKLHQTDLPLQEFIEICLREVNGG